MALHTPSHSGPGSVLGGKKKAPKKKTSLLSQKRS